MMTRCSRSELLSLEEGSHFVGLFLLGASLRVGLYLAALDRASRLGLRSRSLAQAIAATGSDAVWYADHMTDSDLPDSAFERAQMLQSIMISRATGGMPDEATYQILRRHFFDEPVTKQLLPEFVRTSRDLSQFWGHIKPAAGTYQARREIIWEAFQPLLDHLEAANRSPSDLTITDALNFLQAEKVTEAWQKAIARRHTDADGAITSARQLLESVCKTILDDLSIDHPPDADLPKLWALCSQQLNLAPSLHTEVAFKSVLGACQTVVQYLGTIRNRLGDAHGTGRVPARAAPRHAALVVNLAGTMAAFLVETYQARHPNRPSRSPKT